MGSFARSFKSQAGRGGRSLTTKSPLEGFMVHINCRDFMRVWYLSFQLSGSFSS